MSRKVRLACAEGMSRREAVHHFNISRVSVQKRLAVSVPPGDRRTAPVTRPKLDGFTEIIDAWLEADKAVHRKQRHTAKRIFERLRDEHGFSGGDTIVQDDVRERDRYGRPGKGNDKGKGEGLVGVSRRNHMVPIPRFATWDAVNADLEEQWRKRQADVLRGQSEAIGERLARDLAALSELPAAPFDAGDQATGRLSSQALVRYKTYDDSVPVAYGHRDVWIRGSVDAVVIGCGGEILARHPRCHDRADRIFDPVHSLPLIEQKIDALDQAAPWTEWDLPPEFATLRRLMEARMLKMGRRAQVQGLRLLETFGIDDLHAAVKKAVQLGAIGFDAVQHLVLCQVEKRPAKLDLDVCPHLPRAQVAPLAAAACMGLMSEDAA